MGITRAQYLQGNVNEGTVLVNTPQGVTAGDGVVISSTGQISVDQPLVVVNPGAISGYPYIGQTLTYTPGAAVGGKLPYTYNWAWKDSFGGTLQVGGTTFLLTAAQDGLYVYVDLVATDGQGVTASAPTSPTVTIGQQPPSQILQVVNPGAISGNPYVGDTLTYTQGMAIGGTPPYSYTWVWKDSGGSSLQGMGSTFTLTSAQENFSVLVQLTVTDSVGAVATAPTPPTAVIQKATPVQSLIVVNPGAISGNPYVGQTLTYTPGVAIGGYPPYTYTWVWKDSNGNTIQTGGVVFTLSPVQEGLSVYVELTATDSSLTVATANSAPTAVITKEPFPPAPGPEPAVLFPTSTVTPICWSWASPNLTLSSSGCVEFNVNGGTYGQGPSPIVTGDIVCSRWNSSLSCGGAATGNTITGCFFTATYQECGSLTIDRTPDPFFIPPVQGLLPGTEAESSLFTPQGYNSTAYVTCPSTTGTNVMGSLDGGYSWTNIPSSGNSFPINPGQALTVKFDTGLSPLTTYVATIAIGEALAVNTAVFAASTTTTDFPSAIYFPTSIPGTINSPPFEIEATHSPTSLTATGCIEFEVNGGGFSQGPTQVSIGDIITTQWLTTAPCGGAANGTTITGSITNGNYIANGSLILNRVPQALSFPATLNQPTSSPVISSPETPSSYNAPANVTLGPGSTLGSIQASINNGPFVAVPAAGSTSLVINPGDNIRLQGTTGAALSTTYTAVVGIGVSGNYSYATWSVSTTAAAPSVSTPSITNPPNGATGVSTAAPGITLTSSAYSPLNGAGAQQSSSWQVYANAYPLTSSNATTAASGGSYAQSTTYTSSNGVSQPYKNTTVPPVTNPGPFLWYTTPTAGFGSGQSKGGTNISFTVNWVGGLTPANTFSAVTTNNSNNTNWPITYTLNFSDGTNLVVKTSATKQINTLTFSGCNGRTPSSLTGVSPNTPYTGMIGYLQFQINGATISSTPTVLTISGAYTDGFRPGMQIQSASGAAAGGTISAITNSQITLVNTSGTWSSGGGQTIQTNPAGYSSVVNVSGDTTNLTSYLIASALLASGITYYARVQYTSVSSVSSSFSPWSSFAT